MHVVGADGTRRITELKAAPCATEGPVVAGVVTLVDVTDRKRSERASGALVFRDRILNILAHDLRQLFPWW